MSNTSATGGYLVQTELPLPGGLTLLQFLQQVIVGVVGLQGEMVRPKFQKNVPKVLPNPEDNWCAFSIAQQTPDATAFHKVKESGNGSVLTRHIELTIDCSFYGSQCQENAGKLRDGLEISQNRDVLRSGNMGVKEVGASVYVPELHGQVWFPRCDITVIIKRQVDKDFSVLDLTGSIGTIVGQKMNDETENVPWDVQE